MPTSPINVVTFDTTDPTQRQALNAIWSLSDAERAALRFQASHYEMVRYATANLTLAQALQFSMAYEVPAGLSPRASARLAELVAEYRAARAARAAVLPAKTSRKAA